MKFVKPVFAALWILGLFACAKPPQAVEEPQAAPVPEDELHPVFQKSEALEALRPHPLGEAGVGVRPEVEEALLTEDLGLRPLAVEDQAAHLLGEGLRLPHGAKVSSAGRP